jgi:DnaJ-domain-containing protein 1
MVDRAFSGFAALPPPSAGKSWWEILGVSRSASRDEILAAHRKLAVEHHPDRGGDADKAAEINAARDSGLAERSLA